jgi:hypothetical protein
LGETEVNKVHDQCIEPWRDSYIMKERLIEYWVLTGDKEVRNN